ncbi:MAG TPA: AraC family transcriptional regulator [Verrucomicrobiota bacterium]|nr:AraC family transcriptional regulator [Verrucomicrobiota bacterium]
MQRRQAQSSGNSTPDFFSTDVSSTRRFFLNLNPPKRIPLAVVCGGREHCTADYEIHRTTFPFYSIEFVARGRGSVKLNGKLHPLETGHLFSYGPGVRHDINTSQTDPMVKYFVDFCGTQSKRLLSACHLPPGGTAKVFLPNELEAIFDELIRCGRNATRHSPQLCAKLLECLALKVADSRAPLDRAESLAFNTYQQCRQHIQACFDRLKTLQQIATECHVSAPYLCRLFRRYDHESPYQFLLHLKMNRAAELLEKPDALVKQIAEETGFEDPFHFSRTFKSVFGVSPDLFRRLRR